MSKTTALICGVSGQDGSLLAAHLVERGYRVVGTSRDAQLSTFGNLRALGVLDRVETHSMAANDFRSVLQVLSSVRPDEIYNLAGQSSVGLSFSQPVETIESITIATMNLLEALRFTNLPTRFYNAASSESFGDTGGQPADELTPFRPVSPYGVAKAAAYWQVSNYRDAYGVFACSGILFNHDSPLRPMRFVTQKIVMSAARIAAGADEVLNLGNIDIERDWGWAADYVGAMWLMLQQPVARDYVIATGAKQSLRSFCERAFHHFGFEIRWTGGAGLETGYDAHSGRLLVQVDATLVRPLEIASLYGNPARAARELGWSPVVTFPELVNRLCVNARVAASCGGGLS